jgi:hypothetical protein
MLRRKRRIPYGPVHICLSRLSKHSFEEVLVRIAAKITLVHTGLGPQ